MTGRLGLFVGRPPVDEKALLRRKKQIAIILIERKTLTLEEIGDRHGVTRECIRQIVKKHGDGSLVGYIHRKPLIRKPCPACGDLMRVSRVTCSAACLAIYKAGTMTEGQRAFIRTVFRVRLAGATWNEVAPEVGHKFGAGIPERFKKLCFKAGFDPSPVMSDGPTKRARGFLKKQAEGAQS